MVDIPEGVVVAPYVGKVQAGEGSPSFSGYFLRDLHQQGRLNTEIVKRIVEEHGLNSSYDDIMSVITDIRGASITESIARDLDVVASIGSGMN